MITWLRKLFAPKYRVAEVRLVHYRKAEELLSQGNWELHTEREDHNHLVEWVWLERREPL